MLKKKLATALLLLATLATIGVAIATLYLAAARHQLDSISRLKRIGIALDLYHASVGSYPPAFVADGNGRPMHSWRVLILPFLGYDHLYRRYDFREPWDSPKNRALSADMPIEYQSPFPHSSRGTITPYLAVVGEGTAWPGARATKRSDITGRSVNTVLVVEAANSDIDWMEPRDMPFNQVILGLHLDDSPGIQSYSRDEIHVLTAGGNAESLPVGISQDLLSSAFTIRAGTITEQADGQLITRLEARSKKKP